MYIGYMQILYYFIEGTWASMNFGTCRGVPITNLPQIPRDDFIQPYSFEFNRNWLRLIFMLSLGKGWINNKVSKLQEK